jgi:hypothetical protein
MGNTVPFALRLIVSHRADQCDDTSAVDAVDGSSTGA